jgi:uncharacterized protein YhaN
MNNETKELFSILLDVCRQQNDLIRKHNNTYRQVLETLDKSYRELETEVGNLKAKMLEIKEKANRVLL